MSLALKILRRNVHDRWLLVLLAWWLPSIASLTAAQKTFSLAGAPVILEEVSGEVEVRFRSMRFNRASNVWNAEMSLTNRSTRVFHGPFVVLVDSFSGTQGPADFDGRETAAPQKHFYDLSARIPSNDLLPGQSSGARTISLVPGTGAPQLQLKVFVLPERIISLAATRSLNEIGQPLPDVSILESGPNEERTLFTDSSFATASLGQGNGIHTWKFSSPGHLPVWRRLVLGSSQITNLPNPRLTRQNPSTTTLSVSSGGVLSNQSGAISINFSPGSFNETATGRVTSVSAQNLPAFLPSGWSPLQAFWLELNREPLSPGILNATLFGPMTISDSAALVRWNESNFVWEVESILSTNGTNLAGLPISRSGAYVVAVGDASPSNPPSPQVGQPLSGLPFSTVDFAQIRAGGRMEPATSPASRIPERVTATAFVSVTNLGGALSSGLLLRSEIQEDYRLQNGSRLKSPPYEQFLVCYQRPGLLQTGVLQTIFSLRPRLLFGADELLEALLTVDVLPPQVFSGSLIETNGAQLVSGNLRVIISAGDITTPQAGQLRQLDTDDFQPLAGIESNLVAGFELQLGGVLDGRRLVPQIDGLPTNTHFVLARMITSREVVGPEPVERFFTGTNGLLVSQEPNTGERLPGVRGSGQYFLIRVSGPQGIISGIARNVAGQPASGLLMRMSEEPWVTLSGSNGLYQLVSSVGDRAVTVLNPDTGDAGHLEISVAQVATPTTANLTAAATGPRVTSTSPAGGAVKVSRVTPVVVNFSEAINPATLGASGVQLLDTNNSPVPASLSLNLKNTVATILPTSPLAPSAVHRIVLSTNLTDLNGLRIEGPTEFTFTTESDALDRLGAQLTIFEPGATNIPPNVVNQLVAFDPVTNRNSVVAHGSPGTAEPEVPVILVNENAGETSTVLSKPDGSFFGFIRAEAEDFISAVFVNANGTRTTVPATRQLFDNGRVGLYQQGGILEAQSDGGPVQVILAPGAIPERSVFKVSALSVAAVQALLGGVQPEPGSQLLGGVHVEIEGDALKEAAKVSIPLDPSSLNIPAGGDPALGVYALTRVHEINGLKVLEVLDKMEFEGGKLHTASPPFLGLLGAGDVFGAMLAFSAQGGKAVVTGRALARPDGVSGAGTGTPVPGAVVFVDPLAGEGQGGIAVLSAGRFVSVADNGGAFRLLVGLPAVNTVAISVGAVSDRLPGLLAFGRATIVAPLPGLLAMTGNAYFNTDRPIVSLGGPDTTPPRITFAEPTRSLTLVGREIPLRFLASDNASPPTVSLTLQSVEPVGNEPPIFPTNYSFNAGTPFVEGLNVRQNATFTTQRRAKVTIAAVATDGDLNSATSTHTFFVQDNPALFDFGETRPPYVLFSVPQQGAENVDRFNPIQISFNEAIDVSVFQDLVSGLKLIPSAGQPYISWSEDQRDFTLVFPNLLPDKLYTLDVAPAFIRDFAGNSLDQEGDVPDGFVTHYTATFKTAADSSAPVQVQSGGGVVEKDGYFYFIDRGLGGILKIIRKQPADPTAHLVMTQPLLDFPRDLILVPDYSYRLPSTDGTPEVRTNRDLLVITGGLLGGATEAGFMGIGQWLAIYDVTNPENPVGVVTTEILPSEQSTFVKLDWSPPILGLLEIAGDGEAIHLVNLPLFIWAQHSRHTPALDPAGGEPGVDLDGDGQYIGAGEKFPAPNPAAPTVGLINGGLAAVFRPEIGQKWTDFDLQFGGKFIGVTGRFFPGVGSFYRVLIDGGVEVGLNAIEAFAGSAKRVLHVFGVLVELPGGARPVNIALVSEGSRLLVFSINDVQNPELLTTVDLAQVNSSLGLAQSAIVRSDGLIALSCSGGQLLLDPRRFRLPAQSGSPQPSVVLVRLGIGSAVRAFVSDGQLFAVNGGTALISAALTDDVPLSVISILAEDINEAEAAPAFPPANFIAPLPVVRKSKIDTTLGHQLIEITDSLLPGQEPKLRLTAQIQPAAAAFQPVFPEWKVDGVTVARGPRVEIPIPGYSITPLGGIFPPFLILLGAQEHTITCEQHTLTVRVYPEYKSETKIQLKPLTDKIKQGKDVLQTLLELAAVGPITGKVEVDMPADVKFAFENEWKECDDTNAYSNLASWTFDASIGFDPLVGMKGKVMLGPAAPGMNVGIFVEAYGELNLTGGVNRDKCANITVTVTLEGKTGLKAGIEANLLLIEASVEADGSISHTGQLSFGLQKIEATYSAGFDGVVGKITLKLLGGVLEYTSEITLIDEAPLIDPITFEIMKF